MTHISVKVLAALMLCTVAICAQDSMNMNESGQTITETPPSGLVQQSSSAPIPIPDYEPLREADIAWEKHLWREIDTREKLNLPFRYPGAPLISILSEGVLSGEVPAYSDDVFSSQLNDKEVLDLLVSVDTVRVIDPLAQTESWQVIRTELDPSDIVRYRLREIWYFDKETSRVRMRIMAIAPIREYYDENTGVFKYEAPLFWLHFPTARIALARHKVHNSGNDASLLNWCNVFEMRMFSSFVYKESNVHDMRLKDIFPQDGIARLMESDRIESALYNWEHDLWTF